MEGRKVDIRTPHDLGAAARGRRQTLKLSQAEVAAAAGVSRAWVTEFEAGKPTVELGRVLALLEALDLTLDLRASGGTPAQRSPRTRTSPDLGSLMEEYKRGAN
ncbi:MAG TPA: helix-turn-helix domain-containing protein [Kribbella sp.]|uniref:helix-turn-helix domain-containing protein n=1 Tax=Kribbella sp. TaxID=1871183 RepID=UPI002D787AD8|nr:helix-turn-helix domain-containing protein [Kribbella sp.]HET6296287.1 helix-turn-helix domain-containing protein [Kribbella sp.]